MQEFIWVLKSFKLKGLWYEASLPNKLTNLTTTSYSFHDKIFELLCANIDILQILSRQNYLCDHVFSLWDEQYIAKFPNQINVKCENHMQIVEITPFYRCPKIVAIK